MVKYSLYILFFLYLLIFGCTASSLLLGFSLVAAGKAYSLAAVCRLLIAVASLITEQGLHGTWASAVVAYGLSHCRSRTLEHRFSNVVHGLNCSVVFPLSIALAGGFFTTEPLGKPKHMVKYFSYY